MKRHVYDVVVVGAGSAGCAAAVSAAQKGCRTLLVEQTDFPGGIPVQGSLTTLCGLYLSDPNASPQFIYDGFAEEFVQDLMRTDGVDKPIQMGRLPVLPFRPTSFRDCLVRRITRQQNLDVWYKTSLEVVHAAHGRIHTLLLSGGAEPVSVDVGAVIDCSGDSAVSRLAGIPLMDANEEKQTPGVIIPIENAHNGFASRVRRIQILLHIQRAISDGLFHPAVGSVSFTPSLDADRIFIKMNLGLRWMEGASFSKSGLAAKADEAATTLKDFLKKAFEEFAQSRFGEPPYPVLHRTDGRLDGIHRLTRDDVLSARKYQDAATRGCWPIEKWDGRGNQCLEYGPVGEWYDIPQGVLQSVHLQNFFAAGKCISADEDAAASARVIGCCLATGEAAGKLAIVSVK